MNIQSRFKTWEKHYEVVSKMLGEPVFSWDCVRGRIIVEDKVWNDYVKSHPKAIPYWSKISIDNWDDTCHIFAQDGESAQTAIEAEMEVEVKESNNLEDDCCTNIKSSKSTRKDECINLICVAHQNEREKEKRNVGM